MFLFLLVIASLWFHLFFLCLSCFPLFCLLLCGCSCFFLCVCVRVLLFIASLWLPSDFSCFSGIALVLCCSFWLFHCFSLLSCFFSSRGLLFPCCKYGLVMPSLWPLLLSLCIGCFSRREFVLLYSGFSGVLLLFNSYYFLLYWLLWFVSPQGTAQVHRVWTKLFYCLLPSRFWRTCFMFVRPAAEVSIFVGSTRDTTWASGVAVYALCSS